MRKFVVLLVVAMILPEICFAALTAEFTFNGNTTDSVSGLTGTHFGNVKYGKGFLNDAVYLDGDGDYIDYGKGFNLGKDFIFNVWIKPDKENLQRKWATIFAKYETNGYGPYWFGLYYGRPDYWLSNGKGSHQEHVSQTKLNPEQWYMLTYTYSYEKQQLTIYINGEYDNSFSCVPVTQNEDKVTVGRQALMFQPYANLQYKGWIDEMQIFDETLSAENVKNLYNRYVSLSELIIVPTENNPNPTMTDEVTNSAIIFNLNPGYKQGDHFNEEGGLFITNLNVKENLNDEKPITFDVYNTKDAMGIVEYYDKNGKFIRADKIEPHNVVIKDFDSWWKKAKNTFDSIKKYGFGNMPITHPLISTHTPIEAPKGTYAILVTNNQTESVYMYASNLVDNLFKLQDLGKNVRALFKDYLAFNDTTTDDLTKKVKNDLAKKIVNNLLKKLEGSGDSESSLLKKIGKRSIKSLMTKVERQNAYNLVLEGFDLEKALEYVIKNSGKFIWEEGKKIPMQVIRGLLPGNPAILGLDAIKLTANSLDALSKFMNEKHLENVKPMIFQIENVANPTNEVPDISTNETEMLKKLVGVYKGSYFATQGETGLTLTVYEENNHFKALFDFYNLPGRTNAKNGKYYMNVSYDKISGNYKFDAYQWLEKPSEYDFINLSGKLDKNILSGDSFYLNGSRWKFSVSRMGNEANKKIPSAAFSYNGHHYYIYSNVCNTWEDAKKYCESLGGHLAVIKDKAENDALYGYITSRGYKTAYFGLSDSEKEGTWKWIDDSVAYYNWCKGEPNGGRGENYAEFYYKFADGTWNDGNFGHGTQNDSKTFICEWDY